MDSYVGKRLDGRYEIREIIGVGGMAVVYKAYDNIDDRIVAIKILKEEFLANEEFRRRFKNESKAIAVLSHPNIVKVYDVSFGDRLQYIVMEYIEGITLKEYIQQQKVINWKEALHFTTQILRALQHAHDKGIIHRDVKPQNIMLLQNGNIKVTDFGIAHFSRGETRTMSSGDAIGSVHYISPEQARGEITDDKADIYSVGVVLYEMITGKLPFESDNAVSIAIMQLQNEAVHPRDINPQIPIGLEQITLRAMQKNTKDRYQSAAEMLLDLDEFKRNPSIKFDYSYFVDKEPTKYISNPPTTQVRRQPQRPQQIVEEDDDDEYEEVDDDDNKTLPILIGVMGALFAVLFVIIIILLLFSDIFKSNKIEVPDLRGKDYASEVQGNETYSDWNFDVTFVTSTAGNYSNGQICKQSPSAGSKAKKGSTIKIEVVGSGNNVTVPDVTGSTLSAAQDTLKQAGFTVILQSEYNSTVTKGEVIRTDPEANTSVEKNSTITIYYATDEDPNAAEVPNVVGYNYTKDKEDIKLCIEDAGFYIGTVEEKDSEKEAGTILDQSIDGGVKTARGTKINLTISSGKMSSGKTNVTFAVPKSGSATLTVYVNSEKYGTSKTLSCMSTYTYKDLEGSGESNTVVFKLGEETVYECNIDFTKSTPVISNEKSYSLVIIPKITRGTSKDDVISKLDAAGITNYEFSGTQVLNTFYSISPSASEVVSANTTVTVTLS